MTAFVLKDVAVKTRASAQRVTITPGQRHFLIIKYFKVNNNDIRQCQSLSDTDLSSQVQLSWSKYLQYMKQLCWAIKYRSPVFKPGISVCKGPYPPKCWGHLKKSGDSIINDQKFIENVPVAFRCGYFAPGSLFL